MGRGPSSFNLFSLLLLAVVGGSIYSTWKVFPVYWQAWEVDRVLADGASRAYPVSRLRELGPRADATRQLVAALRREVGEKGVSDPEMDVGLNFDGDRVDLTCDYRAIITHPLVERYSVLRMHRAASGSLLPPKY